MQCENSTRPVTSSSSGNGSAESDAGPGYDALSMRTHLKGHPISNVRQKEIGRLSMIVKGYRARETGSEPGTS